MRTRLKHKKKRQSHKNQQFLILITFALAISSIWTQCESVGLYGEDAKFCYEENDPECDGPSEWGGFCDSGQRQSPILIPTSATPSPVPRTIDLYLNNYQAKSFRMQNNGHTVGVMFPRAPNSQPPIALGRWDGLEHTEYRFHSAHFHWGPNDTVGSEHCFERGCHSMELHLVHYRSNFEDLPSAINSQDPSTLAVIGIMFDATSEVGSEGNRDLAPIVENLKQVLHPSHGEWVDVDSPIDFSRFLSSLPGQSNLYNYKGSLTTPQCNERVNWYVFDRPFAVSLEDIERFRNVYDFRDEPEHPLNLNYRPLQPRNKREVYLAMARPS